MRKIVSGLLLAGLLLAGVVAAPKPAHAQQVAVGIVDAARVQSEYKAMQQFNEQFTDFQKKQEEQLAQHQRAMMLTPEEYTKYFDLLQAAPTDTNKKQIAEMEAKSAASLQRLQDLADNKNRTEEQTKEFDALNKIYSGRADELRKLQDDLQKTVLAKRDELSSVITTSLSTAIKSVADEKKLTVVLPKEVVLFGGVDVTTEVLAKLNGAPSAPAAAPAAK